MRLALARPRRRGVDIDRRPGVRGAAMEPTLGSRGEPRLAAGAFSRCSTNPTGAGLKYPDVDGGAEPVDRRDASRSPGRRQDHRSGNYFQLAASKEPDLWAGHDINVACQDDLGKSADHSSTLAEPQRSPALAAGRHRPAVRWTTGSRSSLNGARPRRQEQIFLCRNSRHTAVGNFSFDVGPQRSSASPVGNRFGVQTAGRQRPRASTERGLRGWRPLTSRVTGRTPARSDHIGAGFGHLGDDHRDGAAASARHLSPQRSLASTAGNRRQFVVEGQRCGGGPQRSGTSTPVGNSLPTAALNLDDSRPQRSPTSSAGPSRRVAAPREPARHASAGPNSSAGNRCGCDWVTSQVWRPQQSRTSLAGTVLVSVLSCVGPAQL